MKPLVLSIAIVSALLVGCDKNGESRHPEPVTVPNFVGRNVIGARELAARFGLSVDIKAGNADPVGDLPDAVRTQEPSTGTLVASGATITLFLASTTPVGPGERPIHLNTHCGLSYPLIFKGRAWLPVDKKLRRTINPPRAFGDPNIGSDYGTIRRVDKNTLIYTAANGFEVEYEPTNRRPGSCA